ncbi:MAG: hypothetical protein ACM31I_00240, partial [Deltaproteobacteria bacterium]
ALSAPAPERGLNRRGGEGMPGKDGPGAAGGPGGDGTAAGALVSGTGGLAALSSGGAMGGISGDAAAGSGPGAGEGGATSSAAVVPTRHASIKIAVQHRIFIVSSLGRYWPSGLRRGGRG